MRRAYLTVSVIVLGLFVLSPAHAATTDYGAVVRSEVTLFLGESALNSLNNSMATWITQLENGTLTTAALDAAIRATSEYRTLFQKGMNDAQAGKTMASTLTAYMEGYKTFSGISGGGNGGEGQGSGTGGGGNTNGGGTSGGASEGPSGGSGSGNGGGTGGGPSGSGESSGPGGSEGPSGSESTGGASEGPTGDGGNSTTGGDSESESGETSC